MLIAAHGNSLRALVKYLDDMSEAEIVELNIPTGIPLVYELDDDSGRSGTTTSAIRRPRPRPRRGSRTRLKGKDAERRRMKKAGSRDGEPALFCVGVVTF